MEEIMKTIVKRTVLAVCTLVLALILPTAASAACTGFDDVPETADCYRAIECRLVLQYSYTLAGKARIYGIFCFYHRK